MSIKHALKHHFIPHEGNNYHPHILHTKRTIFYGLFFTALKVFIIAFSVMLPAEAFLAPNVLAEQGQKIIALTNSLRKEQGVPVLSESASLRTSASYKADDMSAQQYFSHTSPDGHKVSYFLKKAGYRYRTAGENLAIGFSDAGSVVDAWIKSPTHYANLVDTDFQEFGVGLVAGTFEGEPTVFVAQHFGQPSETVKAPVVPPEPKKEVVVAVVPPAPTPSPEPSDAPQNVVPVVSAPTPNPVIVKGPEKDIPVADPQSETSDSLRIERDPLPTPDSRLPTSASVASNATTSQSDSLAPRPSPLASSPSSTSPISDSLASSSTVLGTTEDEASDPIDFSQSFVAWKDVDGGTQISPRILVFGEAKSVKASVNGYSIDLKKGEDGLYAGTLTAPIESKELFRVIIPPAVNIERPDGAMDEAMLAWKDPKVIAQTPWERYMQANSWLYRSIPLYKILHGIYLFALVFFSFALILSIVIQFRKQHPHVIAKTCGLIALIIVYLKF